MLRMTRISNGHAERRVLDGAMQCGQAIMPLWRLTIGD
jgi:hypothetical protein